MMYQENTRRGKTQKNNKVIPSLIWNLQRLPLSFLNNLRGRSCIKYKMTSLCKDEALNKDDFRAPLCSGFTLIELLVVVLIIGILAAVALPQYQKAVMKARAAEIVLFVKDAQKAMQLYFMQNGYPESGCLYLYGSSTNNLDKLDITLPVESLTTKGYSVSMGLCNPSADRSVVNINKGGVFSFSVAFDSTLQIMYHGATFCVGYNSSGVTMCKALTEQLGGNCIDAQKDDVCK